MAYKDLSQFMGVLEKRGLLKRISAKVDPVLEMAEINDRVVKQGGPAILFENPVGADVPCVVNLFGSYERMRLALEVDDLDEIGEQMLEFLEPDIPTNIIEKLKALPKLKRLSDFLPSKVKDGPCKERIFTKDPSLEMTAGPQIT